MTPLVTIGIPCFNSEQSISAAIDSVLTQTWPFCEIIVADNGSTDASSLLIGRYGNRIKAVDAQPRGANAARNAILHNATGEWLQFLDADDYLEPHKIARQLADANGGASADVIYSPVWVEESVGGITSKIPSALDPTQDLYAQWIAWHLPQTGGALWRRRALQEIGGWQLNQPCCQEHELYLRALKAGLRFVYSSTPGAVYRIWSEETLCRKDPRLVVKVKTALIDDLRQWMQERGIWQEQHRRIAGQACFEMARTLAKHERRAAQDYYRARKAAGLIHLDGPAAPPLYRLVYNLAGFHAAELVADAVR